MHWCTVALAKVPLRQGEHQVARERALGTQPASHTAHCVPLGLYLPGAHCSHRVFVSKACVPAWQRLHSVPFVEYHPGPATIQERA